MESSNFLIVAKQFQYVISLIFESIWCYIQSNVVPVLRNNCTLINFTQNSNLKLIKEFRKFFLKPTRMESDSFLFDKLLLMVAVMGKCFHCVTGFIFKSIWFYSYDFKHTESATGYAQRIFVKSTCVGECKFLCEIKAL